MGQGIPPEMRVEFALRVQDRRVARHMTQEELGAKVGLARPSVTMIETARCGTSAYRAVLIARALGTTVEDLFGGETGGDVSGGYPDDDRSAVVTPAEAREQEADALARAWKEAARLRAALEIVRDAAQLAGLPWLREVADAALTSGRNGASDAR